MRHERGEILDAKRAGAAKTRGHGQVFGRQFQRRVQSEYLRSQVSCTHTKAGCEVLRGEILVPSNAGLRVRVVSIFVNGSFSDQL